MDIQKVNQNKVNNKVYYDKEYSAFDAHKYSRIITSFDSEFERLRKTHASFHNLYTDKFISEIKGKKVLEIGAGDCLNALILSKLGAIVYVNDLSTGTRKITNELNKIIGDNHLISTVNEDLIQLGSDGNFYEFFDIIIGVAIIHHLEEGLEREIYKSLQKNVKAGGKILLIEPLQNSKLLFSLKLLFGNKGGRPSILKYTDYLKYKETDPHPPRENTTRHYKKIGQPIFTKIETKESGFLYQFVKIFPAKFQSKLKVLFIKIDDLMFENKFLAFILKMVARDIKVTYYK